MPGLARQIALPKLSLKLGVTKSWGVLHDVNYCVNIRQINEQHEDIYGILISMLLLVISSRLPSDQI